MPHSVPSPRAVFFVSPHSASDESLTSPWSGNLSSFTATSDAEDYYLHCDDNLHKTADVVTNLLIRTSWG